MLIGCTKRWGARGGGLYKRTLWRHYGGNKVPGWDTRRRSPGGGYKRRGGHRAPTSAPAAHHTGEWFKTAESVCSIPDDHAMRVSEWQEGETEHVSLGCRCGSVIKTEEEVRVIEGVGGSWNRYGEGGIELRGASMIVHGREPLGGGFGNSNTTTTTTTTTTTEDASTAGGIVGMV